MNIAPNKIGYKHKKYINKVGVPLKYTYVCSEKFSYK
jgi:hypothetical protein